MDEKSADQLLNRLPRPWPRVLPDTRGDAEVCTAAAGNPI